MRHKKKNGDKVVSIIQKLYNFGSFLRAPRKLKRLSTRKKVMICRDILQGIETMHAFDLVHRDLHGKNILLHKEIDPKSGKKTISANLIDFGKTTSAKAAASYAPKVQVPRKYNPPEVFLYSPLEIDAKKVDLYAVGLNLYFFYFKKFPEWVVKEDFLQISQMNDEQKKAFGNLLITKITSTIQKRLNTTKFKECQELKEVILSLCQASPNNRLTAGAAREKLDLFLANNHQELASL